MSFRLTSRHCFVVVFNAELQKAKSKAQITNNLKEEASLCNQLGELLAKSGKLEITHVMISPM